jgi:excisionase family DNA binding protein
MAKEVFSPEEAAGYLGVHTQTIYKLLRAGKLPGRKIGQLWRIPREELLMYLRGSERKRKAGEKKPEAKKTKRAPATGCPVSPELWQLAGLFSGGPRDLAENHDKYLAATEEKCN